MPTRIPEVRSHRFTDPAGRAALVVQRSSGVIYVESIEGAEKFFMVEAGLTGPEILKLASEGQALWDALENLVQAVAARELLDPVTLGLHDYAVGQALQALDQTAATFGRNEPEVCPDGNSLAPGEDGSPKAVVTVHGPQTCPRPCVDCDPGHHWLPMSLDRTNLDESFAEDFRDVIAFDLDHGTDHTLGFYACKHCPAWISDEDHDLLEGGA